MRLPRADSNNGCVIFFIGYAATFILQLILSVVNLPNNTFLWCYAFLSQAVFIIAAVLGSKFYKIDFLKMTGLKTPPSVKQFLLIIPISLAAMAAFAPLASVTVKLLSYLGYVYTPTYADYTSTGGAFALGFFGLCVMPAFGEELLVRGTLTQGLKGKGYACAIFLSALIFALMHANAVQLVHQFCIGAVMAYLVVVTRSVWVSMLFHFLNNFVAILLELLTVKSVGFAAALNSIEALAEPLEILVYLAIALGGAAILLILLIGYNRLTAVRNAKKDGAELTLPSIRGFKGVMESFRLALSEPKETDGSIAMPVGDEKKGFNIGMVISAGFVGLIWLLNVITVWIS